MTEAEKEKLEVARKDGQDEEIPAWADALLKAHKDMADSLHARLDAIEKDRKDARPPEAADAKKDSRDEGEDPTENTEGQRKDESEEERKKREAEGGHKANEELEAERREKEREEKDRRDRKDAKDRKDAAARKDEGDTDQDTDREDRARKDAAQAVNNRQTQAKIAELERQLAAVYREPSIEDRNAIAEVRSRADSVYQAVLGRPVPEAIPGESPISYRKRLADGLRKFSPSYKDERLDSLSGNVFKTVEDQIYADAQVASRTPAVVPEWNLRSINRTELGHNVTEYIGDPRAAWAPFTAGSGGTFKIIRPATTH